MKVKLLVDAPGSPDGVTVNEYSEGEVYEVTDSLGTVFIEQGLAEATEDDVTPDAEPVEEVPDESPEELAETAKGKKATAPTENK